VKENNNYFNNSKAANSMIKFEDLKQTFAISEFGKNRSNVVSYIDFASKDLQNLDSTISRFELAVMDAVYTLLINGRQSFTPEMVANIMTGKEVGKDKNNSTKFEEIVTAVERLSLIRINIDCTDIAREKGTIDPRAKCILSGYLMPVTGYYILSPVKKENKIAYKLDRKPVLYEYAEMMGRVIKVPSKVLAIEGVREDTLFTILKQEIIKEIETMKNSKNQYMTRDVTYEWSSGSRDGGLFSRIGLKEEDYANNAQWRKRKCKINKQVSVILDHLIDTNYISAYQFNKDKGTIIGFHVEL
jgi:hypothetical protein